MLEILGMLGILISAAAYVPQVVHLAREHCSAGISSRACGMWLGGALLVGLVALDREDPIFMILQGNTLVFAAVILFLSRKYRGQACEGHSSLADGLGLSPRIGSSHH